MLATLGTKLTRRTKETASSRASGWWTHARPAPEERPGRRGTTNATLSTDVTMTVVAKVDEDVGEVVAEVRCADVVVEEKVVDAVAAVEVERVAAGVARETMTGSLGTTELASRLKTSEEVAARVTGEPLRTMCLRRAKKQTQPSTLRAKKKLPPRRSPRHQESSPLRNWRPSWQGKRAGALGSSS